SSSEGLRPSPPCRSARLAGVGLAGTERATEPLLDRGALADDPCPRRPCAAQDERRAAEAGEPELARWRQHEAGSRDDAIGPASWRLDREGPRRAAGPPERDRLVRSLLHHVPH